MYLGGGVAGERADGTLGDTGGLVEVGFEGGGVGGVVGGHCDGCGCVLVFG